MIDALAEALPRLKRHLCDPPRKRKRKSMESLTAFVAAAGALS